MIKTEFSKGTLPFAQTRLWWYRAPDQVVLIVSSVRSRARVGFGRFQKLYIKTDFFSNTCSVFVVAHTHQSVTMKFPVKKLHQGLAWF